MCHGPSYSHLAPLRWSTSPACHGPSYPDSELPILVPTRRHHHVGAGVVGQAAHATPARRGWGEGEGVGGGQAAHTILARRGWGEGGGCWGRTGCSHHPCKEGVGGRGRVLGEDRLLTRRPCNEGRGRGGGEADRQLSQQNTTQPRTARCVMAHPPHNLDRPGVS